MMIRRHAGHLTTIYEEEGGGEGELELVESKGESPMLGVGE